MIPYEDQDCWGLVRAIYAGEYGIDLPAHADVVDREEQAEVSKIMAERESIGWLSMARGEEREGDVIRLWVHRPTQPCHLGVVLTPGRMIHTRRASGSVIERYDVQPWTERVESFWRHESRA